MLVLLLLGASAKGATGDYKVVLASEILNEIDNNTSLIHYDGILIKGDLYLSQLRPINSSIRIKNSTIYGYVDFSNCVFYKDVNFENTSFGNHINFNGAQFLSKAEFSNCNFGNYANFEGSKFNKPAIFKNSHFYAPASFNGAVFDSYADFQRSRFLNQANFGGILFNNAANFEESKFNNTASFDGTDFKGLAEFISSNFKDASFKKCGFFDELSIDHIHVSGWITFNYADFVGQARFKSSSFSRDASFIRCTFEDQSDFEDSIFEGNAKFTKSKFNGIANFYGTEFHNNTDFSSCSFNDTPDFRWSIFDKYANFMDCDFKSDILADDGWFKGTLNLNRTNYKNFYVRWPKITKLQYNETAYNALIKNFKNLGLFEDANSCYYQLMCEKGNETVHKSYIGEVDSIFLSIPYFFAWILYGFGTRPDLPFIWSMILIALFTVFWYRNFEEKSGSIFEKYGPAKEEMKKTRDMSFTSKLFLIWNALKLSFSIFLSGTKIFINPPEIPKEFKNHNPWINRMYLAERTLGAVFFMLFFFALSKTILAA